MKVMPSVLRASIFASALLLLLGGCQTRITATKNPEQILPIQQLATVNGTNVILTTGYAIASGGWCATARSPLYATEALRGLEIAVSTNGTVFLSLEAYSADLSTNAVPHTKALFSGAASIAAALAK